MKTATPHKPNRDTWLCLEDGQRWPCETWRAETLADHENSPDLTRLHLALLMAHWMARAAKHLPDDAAALYIRFMGWIPTR